MAEKCENVLITVKVIDMVLIGGPESFQVIVNVKVMVMVKIVGLDPQDPHSYTPWSISPLFTLLIVMNR